MKITFELNGENRSLESPSEKRLVDLLREECGLTGTKSGCYSGECGSCFIMLNGKVVQSCLVPAFAARGTKVVTIEGFLKTREGRDIVAGFHEAGYSPCSFCVQSRVFTVMVLLESNPTPSRADISEAVHGITCRCSDLTSFISAIGKVAIRRGRRRRSGRA